MRLDPDIRLIRIGLKVTGGFAILNECVRVHREDKLWKKRRLPKAKKACRVPVP